MQLFSYPLSRGVLTVFVNVLMLAGAMLAPAVAQAVDVTASDGVFTDRVQVNWTKEDNVEYYTIFRCTSADIDTCQNIGKREKNESRQFEDFSAEPLVVYDYRVTVCAISFTALTVQIICGEKSEADTGYIGGVAVDDFGDSCNQAMSVGENSTTAGSLETPGDKDYFQIQVSTPGELIVRTRGDTDTAGALKDSNCSDIATSSSGGDGSNFQIRSNVQAGTYFVETSGDANATGNYQLGVRLQPDDDVGNSCAEAREVNPNSQWSGSLESGGDLDYYRIDLISAGTLTLSSIGTTDTFGSLKDSNCSTIAQNDNGGETSNFQIIAEVSAGTYFLEARGGSAAITGNYEIRSEFVATDDHGNNCDIATGFSANGSIAGVLEGQGDLDYFHINIAQRGTLQLMTNGATDTYGTLLGSDCLRIQFDDDSGEGANFLIQAELVPGDYYIVTSGFANLATGPYELVSSFVVASETGGSCAAARELPLGSRLLDELETPLDQDFFQINMNAEGTLELRSRGATDTLGTLRDANCDEITSNDDGGENTNFAISALLSAGTYYLEVRGFGETTGVYNVESNYVPPDDFADSCTEATSVSLNSMTDGLLGGAGDHDLFRVELDEAAVLFIQTTGGSDTFGTLRNSNCGFIRRNDDGGNDLNTRIATYLTPGVYFVDISGYNETATGPYQLSVSTEDDGLGVDLTLNSGLNDAWFNPETPGQGFFVTIFPETGLIFVSWFTHETFFPDGNATANLGDSGHRWYTAIGNIFGNEAGMNLELTTGGRFNSSDPVNQSTPGTLYLRFDDCSNGQFYFNLPEQGLSGWIPVQRVVNDNVKVCDVLGYLRSSASDVGVQEKSSPLAAKSKGRSEPMPATEKVEDNSTEAEPLSLLNYGLNDAWYNPAWPGQGFFVTVLPDIGGIFISWFTFDSTAPGAEVPFNVGSPDHRWLTAFGYFEGNEADLNIELTQYGLFNDPEPVSQTPAGTMSVRFDDCFNATISYYLDQTGESGEINIVRALVDNSNIFECEFPLSFPGGAE